MEGVQGEQTVEGGITKESCSLCPLLHVCISFNVLILPLPLIMYEFLLFLFYSLRSAGFSDLVISLSTYL